MHPSQTSEQPTSHLSHKHLNLDYAIGSGFPKNNFKYSPICLTSLSVKEWIIQAAPPRIKKDLPQNKYQFPVNKAETAYNLPLDSLLTSKILSSSLHWAPVYKDKMK